MSDKVKVLFVCTGNICRSPMAESIFAHLAKEAGVAEKFEIDGAGTGGWHIGQTPDHRTIQVLKDHGIPWLSRARRIEREDLQRFDVILAMDKDHLRDLLQISPSNPRVKLMLSHDPDARTDEVPDPYYGDLEDFEFVYELLLPACQNLLKSLT